MYESPITEVISDISTQIIQEKENQLMMQMRQTVGYDIDKNELIKALQYDRDQYKKGYADAKREIKERFIQIIKNNAFEHTIKDNDYFMGYKEFKFINVDCFNDLFGGECE